MSSPRRVRNTPTVALYECRLLKSVKTASLLRHVEQRLKKWRGVQRWSLQCYCSPRGEVVVQAVVERAAVASRVDNLLQAWRKLVVKLLPGVQEKQLKRGVWLQDTLVDVRVMVEAWEAACAKLGAEAAVDGGAVRCSYLEPALPSASAASSAVSAASGASRAASVAPSAAASAAASAAPCAAPSAARASALLSAATASAATASALLTATQPTPEPRPLPSLPAPRSSVPRALPPLLVNLG
jgi:hypothetical protein